MVDAQSAIGKTVEQGTAVVGQPRGAGRHPVGIADGCAVERPAVRLPQRLDLLETATDAGERWVLATGSCAGSLRPRPSRSTAPMSRRALAETRLDPHIVSRINVRDVDALTRIEPALLF